MNITSVHFKILSCLSVDNYSINDISEILNISIFKVRRCLKDLEYLLKEESTLKIHEKLKEDFKVLDEVKNIQRFTAKERKGFLILQFLESDIVNLTLISEKLLVNRRTLVNDLQSLKKELEIFNLKVVSYNSYGISLEGLEKNKREFFELYIIKIFIEEKYLPKAFQKFFNEVKEIKRVYNISKIIDQIYRIYEESGILRHTYISLHIEVLIYLSIIRKEFEDGSVNSSRSLKTKEKEIGNGKLDVLLESIDFFSNYERTSIKEFYLKRNKENFFETNKDEILELKNLFNYLSKKMEVEINLNENLLFKLTVVIAVMRFKKIFDITEIYLFNKKVAGIYFNKFKLISNLIKKYYKNIDSFDNTILSMVILNEINKDVENKIEKLKNIIVIYNFLSIEFIKDICKELVLGELINNIQLISYRDIDYYLELNKINGIIFFEDIIFDEKYDNIRKVRFNLPIIRLDKFKLSIFFILI
ncbi:hypothetical protein HS141_05245 [Cetobacterium somerae]|uniref:hypothetical protein n=1 Tax=Cetobacterium somerae TaxID=188913 RepID=UPI00211DD87B|nr:hypothetical protein [Cetobacterium somerae]MCQ9626375.1 hypothetical protein [Cetobacterium somerae]